MARYDAFSRRELKRLRREWLRRNRVALTLLSLGLLLALTVSGLLLAWGSHPSWAYYALGLAHAGAVGGCIHMANAAFLAHDRRAIGHVRGAWGEENTREELKRARKKRLVWDWVDSIDFARGDLDHVVITRNGGVVAIDSKWRSQVDAASIHEMTRSGMKSRTRTEGLTRTLLNGERGKRRARSQPVVVTPAVVLWGSAQHEVPGGHQVRDGVHFVAGRHLVAWLGNLDHEPVDKSAAKDLAARLKKFRGASQPSV